MKGAAGTAVVGTNLGAFVGLADASGGSNAITAENALPGAPPSEWESYGSSEIVGYAAGFTFSPGDTVPFKVATPSTNYRIRVYRMGWYAGNGARHVADLTPVTPLPFAQPAPVFDPVTNLTDAGNWAVSASWTIPGNAVSGVYYALFERLDVPGQSNHTYFVVRRSGPADILVQTSDTTWHAYTRWGGASLYWGDPVTREDRPSYKVSYNRPIEPDEGENDFLNVEYPLVRFLERNGYDVAYCSGLDAHRSAAIVRSGKVFISSGHDEYWSDVQRANVEAARDAGTHLIFFSGNEVFWKIRFEPSVDGANTPDMTLVCYKETLASAKIDPTAAWTGTWRDPRFSPPSDGGLPENALTGQLFRCINPTGAPDFTIQVPWTYSAMRFWRDTAVASLPTGAVADLALSTLGYEWDEDVDNGFRPAGLIHLSQTTAVADAVLQDYGKNYAPGAATHHLTMYRAPSGALVFGAGTVQWAYGLDSYHEIDPESVPDVTMQQATVNLLADMGVQPASLMAGLVAASASADALPPVSAVTSPADGAVVPVGVPITVTGSAVDAGGGVVAAVEVSTDGGASWHRATGTDSWSYVFVPLALGPATVLTRGVDDSLNMEDPGPGVTFQAVQRPLPAPLFAEGSSPATVDAQDPGAIEVGVRFRPLLDGFVTGVRFYKAPANTGVHVGSLWSTAGQLLGTATFANETATGWQQVALAPIPVSAGVTYIASVFMPNGHYSADAGFFNTAYELWPMRGLANGEDGPNGLYRYGSAGFPTSTFGSSNYWVDAVFDIDDQQAPTVVDHAPGRNVELVAPTTTIVATFSEAMNPATITMEVRAPGGELVSGATTYDAPTRRATFTPAAPLAAHTRYAVTIPTASDQSGGALAAPFSWEFTTSGAPGTVPTGIWDSASVPTTFATGETSPVELGVRLRALEGGLITALRFYKPAGSAGPHIGHLWDEAGTLLATVSFDDETASGWQQANLPSAIAVNANQRLIASCHFPGGVYPYSSGFFAGTSASRGPIEAEASTGDARNGLYVYGPPAVPTGSYLASNYWVDVVFTIPPDGNPPTLTNVVPAPDLISVDPASAVQATFSEAVLAESITFTVARGSNQVAGTVSYDGNTRTATFTPAAPLASGAVHTASVSAADVAGNAMPAATSWSFMTVVPAGATPATLWDSSALPAVPAADDPSAIELGLHFTVDRPGVVTAVRFYKGPGNTGTHVGHLWTASGTLLGTCSFPNETATGWQQAAFASPIAVQPGTGYVVSYHTSSGRYAVSGGYFNGTGVDRSPLHAGASAVVAGNGRYAYGAGGFPTSSWNGSNYWVDVVFQDVQAPQVVGTSPGAGAVEVVPETLVTASFDEPVVPSSITIAVQDAGGAPVGGAASYDAQTRTVTFTPAAPLASGATYTASVSGAVDLAGNAMTAPVVWSFSVLTATASSLWPATAVPAVPSSGDTSTVELGLRFSAGVSGTVRGVRFYKGAGNGGAHVGRLWTADGTLLASTTFGAETPSGWQYAPFAAPVPIAAGTIHVVSYLAPNGNYSVNSGYFGTDHVAGPLTAPAGANGVFAYGGGFPTGSWGSSNYWVDVVFLPD